MTCSHDPPAQHRWSMEEGNKFDAQLPSALRCSMYVHPRGTVAIRADMRHHPTADPRNPNNHVPVHNEDCVITSQFFIIYDIP